jgi:vacuolar-type H+-ATPase subunit I/STV1
MTAPDEMLTVLEEHMHALAMDVKHHAINQVLDDLACELVRLTDNPDLIVHGIGERIRVWRRMLAQEKADNETNERLETP